VISVGNTSTEKDKKSSNPTIKPKDPTEFINQELKDAKQILDLALSEFNQNNYSDAAKKFRQVASILKDVDALTDENQNYRENNTLNDLSGKEWIRHTKSWMIIDGRPSDISKEIKNHPGTYPPDLACNLIEFFTKEGGWVFDPFMGIGSTLAACVKLKRNCWGIELNQEYAKYAMTRIPSDPSKILGDSQQYHVIVEDARNCADIWKKSQFPKADFLITSPPYFNILAQTRGGVISTHKKRISEGLDEVYSDDDRDLGNIDSYRKYLEDLTDIFLRVKPILQDGAYLCIIVQNFRPKDGIMIPLAWDIANNMKEHFTLRQEYVWLQDQKQLGIWGYPTTYVSNVNHHYCLIFQNK
jgi:DNA modification methylase